MISSRVTHFLLALVENGVRIITYLEGFYLIFLHSQNRMNRMCQRHRKMSCMTSILKEMRIWSTTWDSVVCVAEVCGISCHTSACELWLIPICVGAFGVTETHLTEERATSTLVTRCSHVWGGVEEFKNEVSSAQMVRRKLDFSKFPASVQPACTLKPVEEMIKHITKLTFSFAAFVVNLSVRLKIESSFETRCSTKDKERLLSSPWQISTCSFRLEQTTPKRLTYLCWAFVSTYVGLVILSRIIMVLTGARTLRGTMLERGCKSLEKETHLLEWQPVMRKGTVLKKIA